MYNPRAAAVAVAVVALAAAFATSPASGARVNGSPDRSSASAGATGIAPAGTSTAVAKGTSPVWRRISSVWPRQRAVTVTDVTSIGNEAWVSGNSVKRKDSIPVVQDCAGSSCRHTKLPRPGGNPTFVTSISAVSATDIWAAGYDVEPKAGNKVQRPVWWHFHNGSWDVYDVSVDGESGPDSIALVDLDVANKSKAFALGRYDSGDTISNTLYRWNGNGWKELSQLDQDPPDFPEPCATQYFTRHWADVIVRSGDAVVVGTCGAPSKSEILEDGAVGWIPVKGQNPPTGGTWDCGAFVGQQLWLIGEKQGQRRIMARDGSDWSKLSTKGIPAGAHITDIHGVNGNKVWAVGWAPTGHHHRIALSWHFGGGNWHATEVPTGRSRSRLVAVSMEGDGAAFAVGNDDARSPAARAVIIRAR